MRPLLHLLFWLVGQDGILRRLGKPPSWRVNNPPQADSLPYEIWP
jgi:hypothetical protein